MSNPLDNSANSGKGSDMSSPKFGAPPSAYGDCDRYRTCDACRVVYPIEKKHLLRWYGNSNCIICDKLECRKEMDRRYEEMCREIDQKRANEEDY